MDYVSVIYLQYLTHTILGFQIWFIFTYFLYFKTEVTKLKAFLKKAPQCLHILKIFIRQFKLMPVVGVDWYQKKWLK